MNTLVSKSENHSRLFDAIDNHNSWLVSRGKFGECIDIRNNDFSFFTKHGANLESAHFSNCILAKSNLAKSNFLGASFLLCYFQWANLKGANFEGADLSNSKFMGANLKGANLKGANLSGCNFRNANLSGCDFRGANIEYTDFSSAILTGANLSGCDLRNASLIGASLAGANLKQTLIKTDCKIFTDVSYRCFANNDKSIFILFIVYENGRVHKMTYNLKYLVPEKQFFYHSEPNLDVFIFENYNLKSFFRVYKDYKKISFSEMWQKCLKYV